MAVSSISWMKVSDGALIEPIHLNTFSAHSGSAPNGAGLQDMAMVLVEQHNHVDKTLFEKVFGSGHPYNLPGTNISSASTVLTSQTTWEAMAVFSMKWVSAKNTISTTTPLFGSLGSDFQVQSTAPNHILPTGTVTPTSTNGYGFNSGTLFAGPIAPESIKLTNDVNPLNQSFLDHIRDASIHFRTISAPTPVSDNDHMGSRYGYLNIYDIADGSLNLSDPLETKRSSDDYFFNLFDSNEDSALEKVAATKDANGDPMLDIAHPVLYEEGVYSWQGNKLRQFKLIKADPDDSTLAQRRATQSPMDALFVGGGPDYTSVVFSPVAGRYVKTLNCNIDSYFYGNWYVLNNNREYKAGVGYRYVEFLMSEGMGYQPTRGFSQGI